MIASMTDIIDIDRRRMEDEVAAIQAAQEALEAAEALAAQEASENNSLLSPCLSSIRSPGSGGSSKSSNKKKNGTAGRKMQLEDMLAECAIVEQKEEFTGISCLLITWKSNPEVEELKVLVRKETTLVIGISPRSYTWRNL